MRSIFTWALLALMLALGAALGAAGYHYWQVWHLLPASYQAEALPVPSKVTALGRIEPADGIVAIGSPVPDRLQGYLDGVCEGARVFRGQSLAELASRADRQLEYDLVCLQIREGEQKLQNVRDLGQRKIALEELRKKQLVLMEPLELAQQRSKVAFLEQQAKTVRKNHERLHQVPGSTISQQEHEQQDLLVSQADAELSAAREALQQFVKGNELKRELAQAQIDAARAELTRTLLEIPLGSLNQQKALARRRLDQTLLTAPCDGEVLKIYTRPGEMVASQPVLQIADTSRMVVTAEVYETDIDKVQLGQSAVVWSRVWPDQKLAGTVTAKGHMIARNRVFDTDPTAAMDRRVLEVTIRLDNPAPASHLIHHQVYVEIALPATAGGPP